MTDIIKEIKEMELKKPWNDYARGWNAAIEHIVGKYQGQANKAIQLSSSVATTELVNLWTGKCLEEALLAGGEIEIPSLGLHTTQID